MTFEVERDGADRAQDRDADRHARRDAALDGDWSMPQEPLDVSGLGLCYPISTHIQAVRAGFARGQGRPEARRRDHRRSASRPPEARGLTVDGPGEGPRQRTAKAPQRGARRRSSSTRSRPDLGQPLLRSPVPADRAGLARRQQWLEPRADHSRARSDVVLPGPRTALPGPGSQAPAAEHRRGAPARAWTTRSRTS